MTANDEINAIKDIILDTVECERIYLFGSYAYGTPHKDSDYDFYVVLRDDCEQKPAAMLDAMNCALTKRRLRVPVDLHANYKRRFIDRSGLLTLERTIAEQGVVLYDRG